MSATPQVSREAQLDAALASPSRSAWSTVTAMLDTFGPDELVSNQSEIEQRLAAWPDRLRTVPGRWFAKLLEGGDEPRLELTRTLDHVLMSEPERSSRLAWTETPRLRRLTTVRLHDEVLGDEGAHRLAATTTLLSLTELSIGAGIGPIGGTKLLSSPQIANMRTIGLNRNRIGAASIEALVATSLPGLEALHLGRNGLDDAAMRALALLRASRLEKLDLDFNAFGVEGLAALASSTVLASVRELNLSNNVLTRESREVIAACRHLAGLRVLFLHNCALTDDALGVLLASPYLQGLHNLAVSENQLSMRSFRALAECSSLDALYELDVCHNRVDPHEAEACLRPAPHLRGLKRLCV